MLVSNVREEPRRHDARRADSSGRRRLHRLSGRHFHRRVEVNLSCPTSRPHRAMAWSRNRKTVFAQSAYVKFNRSFDPPQHRVNRFARRAAPGQVRNGSAPIAAWIPVDADEILDPFHDFGTFNPACRFTDPSVPFGISSPRFPLTVTRPGFGGLLELPWLPSVLISAQPSASRSRITSRTFTRRRYHDESQRN